MQKLNKKFLTCSWLVDKLLIAYIYTSTTGIIPQSLSFIFRNTCYFVFFIIILFNFKKSTKFYIEITTPIFFAILYILLNLCVFLLYDSTVIDFIVNIKYWFFLYFILLIPMLANAKYSVSRYLCHFFFGTIIQCFAIVILANFSRFFDPSILENIDLSIHLFDGFTRSIRVTGRLNVLLISTFFYIFFLQKKNFLSYLLTIVLLFSLYWIKSFGVYLALLIGFSVYVLSITRINKFFIKLYVFGSYIFLHLAVVYMPYFFISYPEKYKSVIIKLNQIYSLLDLPLFNFIFGYGNGYIFYDSIKKTYCKAIEVLLVYWIYTSGIIGFLIIVYVFLYPLFSYKKYLKMEKTSHRKTYRFILATQVAIFFSSISNPYIMSGSTALFFVFFYCYLYYEAKQRDTHKYIDRHQMS